MLISVMVIVCLYTTAQESSIKPLTIGDTLPANLVLTNVYNYPDSTIRLSDLKGKLVILDFWATWCGSCIEQFPKMQQLQNKFRDQTRLFLINTFDGDSREKVQSFFEKRLEKTGFRMELPYSLGQSSLAQYFPHNEIPHYIWIDKNGIIKGITGHEDVNENNIATLLKKESSVIYTKKDDLRFNPAKPLLIDENGGDDAQNFIFRSVITNFKPDLGSLINYTTDAYRTLSRITVINYPLITLFKISYPDLFSQNRGIVVSDTSVQHLFTDVNNNGKYCYELITRIKPKKELLEEMQQTLSEYFNIVPVKQTIYQNCYLLTVNNDKNGKILMSGGGRGESDLDKETIHKFIKNKPLTELVNYLNAILDKPVIDNSGIEQNIDITFPEAFPLYTPLQVKNFLKSKGILLHEKEVLVEQVFLKSKSPQKIN